MPRETRHRSGKYWQNIQLLPASTLLTRTTHLITFPFIAGVGSLPRPAKTSVRYAQDLREARNHGNSRAGIQNILFFHDG